MKTLAQTLLIGFGNPGRQDDGLGPAFVSRVDALKLHGVVVETDYQLIVEHSALVATFAVVIFVDALARGTGQFIFRPIRPAVKKEFTTHLVEPASILSLAHSLYGAKTKGFALGIRGYKFDDFEEKLTSNAEENLEAALNFLAPMLGNVAKLERAAARPGAHTFGRGHTWQ